jgi:hypothetical protein
VFSETERGLETRLVGREVGQAYSWESPLDDYSDVQKLAPKTIVVDFRKTEALVSLAEDVLGDILKVTPIGKWWWSFGMAMDLAYLRGMERMLLDMFDCADGLHRLMSSSFSISFPFSSVSVLTSTVVVSRLTAGGM